jgi:hypothetical protein
MSILLTKGGIKWKEKEAIFAARWLESLLLIHILAAI